MSEEKDPRNQQEQASANPSAQDASQLSENELKKVAAGAVDAPTESLTLNFTKIKPE